MRIILFENSTIMKLWLWYVIVTKYCEEMEGRVKPLLVKKEPLSETEMEKFGKKDSEAYPFSFN